MNEVYEKTKEFFIDTEILDTNSNIIIHLFNLHKCLKCTW